MRICHGSSLPTGATPCEFCGDPVFTAAAIGILALGIGANAAVFSLVQTC